MSPKKEVNPDASDRQSKGAKKARQPGPPKRKTSITIPMALYQQFDEFAELRGQSTPDFIEACLDRGHKALIDEDFEKLRKFEAIKAMHSARDRSEEV